MSLNMSGHIDAVFVSAPVTITGQTSGGWDAEGNPIAPTPINSSYIGNIQPLNDKELENLLMAGERIVDGRKVYINNGDFASLRLAMNVDMLGKKWKVVRSDVRPWRKYAKLVVSRYDDQ